jgi:hypothetical protein
LHVRVLVITSALCLLAGGGLIWRACQIPVYTDADAPARLSVELEKLPREQRFEEWYTQLAEYETAHKRIYDWGQGGAALGIGGLLGAAWLAARKKFSRARGQVALTVMWLLAWATQVPCVAWYYGVRQQRFDYPVWGDSIGIPMFSRIIMSIVSAIVTTPVLLALTVGWLGTEKFVFRKPTAALEWGRLVLLVLWMTLLVLLVMISVADGKVTFIIPCTLGLATLFAVAFGMEKNTAPRNPLTVSDVNFARWFKFTLIHPVLSLVFFGASAIFASANLLGILAYSLLWCSFIINLPGLLILQALPLPYRVAPNMPHRSLSFLPAIILTWALIVAAAWFLHRWLHRQRSHSSPK